MTAIMTRCPVTSRAVPTGLHTRSVKFDSLPDVGIRMRCPACGEEHMWRKRDVWLAYDVAQVQPKDSAA